jgi:tripartite-type tricarboxylate transporter receptor subunit TctC
MRRVAILLSLLLLQVGVYDQAVAQQSYPNKPITWVVPFAPGGNSDSATRLVARSLSERLGQPVIVENKPGAGGLVGTEYVAHAKPDGYTLLFASPGPMATMPAIRKSLSYDPLTSFTPLYGMASSPLVMVVAANAPYKTFRELVEYAEKHPGKLNFGSIGPATAQHLTGELFAMGTNTHVVHIPYKGTPPAIADVMAGTLDFLWDFAVALKPMIDAGKLRPLAVSSTKRLPSLPDVPTTTELGYPDIVFDAWYTVVMPKAVAKEVSDKFTAAFAEVMKEPEIIKFFENTGSQILPPMSGDKLTEFFQKEGRRIKAIVERAKIPVE